jgi:NCS1 family nucleobase:cation symporter-1
MPVATEYREEVLKVEPKGVEAIDQVERHGRPSAVFTLWWGANVEFATLSSGALGTIVFGLSFWSTLAAIALGTLLGAAFLGALSTFGARLGVPQLIHSRKAFGYFGNFVPGVLNFVAGFAWFAVNTVLGVYALEWLLHLPFLPALAIMVVIQVAVAIFGYNMIHSFERYMAIVLTAIFLIVTYYALTEGHFGVGFQPKTLAHMGGVTGGFILMLSVAFSYVLGWMPFASDYTRYLPADTPPRRIFWNAFASTALSCIWLEFLGAALATVKPIFAPTDLVTGIVPHGVAVLTMLAVVVGTVTANVLNIYSGALSALVVGVRIRRWQSAVLVGILGTVVAIIAGQGNFLTSYENFLFLLGYWVAPWLAVVFADYFLVQRGAYRQAMFYDRSGVRPGLWAWLAGVVAAVPFMNQTIFVGPIARQAPGLGDVAYFVGFVVAGLVYLAIGRREPVAS